MLTIALYTILKKYKQSKKKEKKKKRNVSNLNVQ